MKVVVQILLKALTNLPHTDFTLCKCLIDAAKVNVTVAVVVVTINLISIFYF